MKALSSLQSDVASGRVSSKSLVEDAVTRAKESDGEGERVFISHYGDQACAHAEAIDLMLAAGGISAPLLGIPVSVKDLFDVAGEVTRAGSVVRQTAAPAKQDAAIVARLKAAGAVIVGRTNMTEFAYSGVGLNPHYGTPANPWDRKTRRIPGGSSSGAAVSVADGMAACAIGTDTGGSVRIPAALCGLTGFKPTSRRVPKDGCFPLSETMDSIGPLAPTVACCALLDAIMSGEQPKTINLMPLRGLRLAIPKTLVFDEVEAAVATVFERAVKTLSDAGALVDEISCEFLTDIPRVSTAGGIVAAEAFALHRKELATRADEFDPRVASRVLNGEKISGADLLTIFQERQKLQSEADRISRPYDALILPTTPRVAPPIADLESDDGVYGDTNLAMLRNCALFNFLDRCAISLPIHKKGDAPVGLMLVGETMGDQRLLSAAQAVESVVRQI